MILKNGDTVLVTGGCGFIGSALVREIRASYGNSPIKVLDDLSSGIRSNVDGISGVDVIEGSILDKDKVTQALQDVDVVFHLAALPFIPDCYLNPRSFVGVNVNGTTELFMKALGAKAKLFIHISTSEVYGEARYVPIDEAHPTNPLSTYAASKLSGEMLVHTLHKEHGLPTIILRPFNTYGPRDSHPRIIPELVKQSLKDKEFRLGNLDKFRDFNYVEDIAKGILLAAGTSKAIGRVLNLCSGSEISGRELVSLVTDLVGNNGYHITIEKTRIRPYDVNRLCGDGRLAREILNWMPQVKLEDGLKLTIEWYKKAGKWRWEC